MKPICYLVFILTRESVKGCVVQGSDKVWCARANGVIHADRRASSSGPSWVEGTDGVQGHKGLILC